MASLVWRKDRQRWYAYFQSPNGKRAGKSLSDAPRREELSKHERALALAEAEGVEENQSAVPIDEIDVDTAASLWLDDCKVALALVTYRAYVSTANDFIKHVSPDGRRVPLQWVSQQQVREYRDKRLALGLAPRTVVNDLKCLSAMFGWIRRQRDPMSGKRWIDENPCEDVRKPKQNPRRVVFPTNDEVLKMVAALPGQCAESQALGYLGAYCGMRRNEVLHLTWDDVDFDARVIRVIVSKSIHPRPLPMHPIVADFLRGLDRGAGGRIFPEVYREAGGVGHPYAAKKFNNWLRDLGFGWTHHSLRRWFNDLLRRDPQLSGAARRLVVGHQDEQTNRLYQNPHVDEARPIVEALPRPEAPDR